MLLAVYYLLVIIAIGGTILPRFNDQHWFFRVWDFGKVQLTILQTILFVIALIFLEFKTPLSIAFTICLVVCIIYNTTILIRYTTLYKVRRPAAYSKRSKSISLLSVNVYQFNSEYQRLIDLVRKIKPDIFLTMESNKDWENALNVLDSEFKHSRKIAQENTYGMHFYTNLEVSDIKTNYFVADDLPSVETILHTKDGYEFVFFGVHPPPPSPTEEETSKERDGELMCISKEVRKLDKTVVVAGDFNNVAWARTSLLFKRTSDMLDPRIGRGFVSTFHADYWFLRFPIDLFFHTKDVYIEEFKTLEHVGSDHLPLYCKFYIGDKASEPDTVDEFDKEQPGDLEEAEELIKEGKKEQSNRPIVAKP
ncbi:endonuclease/exonuclease/phosphatase family protein [Aegicerativicinus sediminis]|uniref:endonuclease/exonuclease/phosphatase family protein n=1 Tax=Aegicerativicinus sediminis TaxID=2893202 RepID=UPI001E36896E|nr:endonuclease/exonuclease/phosphatase family protein [Aegicerativicinus sediminis]